MSRRFDIVVAGGGITGLCVALLLARGGKRGEIGVTVIDAGDRPAFDPSSEIALRVSAIASGTADILASSGVWQSITATRACPFHDMRVWDACGEPDGPEALHFDAAEFAVAELGFIVENTLIQSELLSALESTDATVAYRTSIERLTRRGERFRVEAAEGRALAADLLIAADGAGSLVRHEAGIRTDAWRYPQAAFVTHLLPEKPHRQTAWQRFLPSGPIALLPLSDGRVSTVWSTTPAEAERATTASDRELSDMLSAASDFVLGRLTPKGPRGSFPLRAQHARQYVLPGLALIGDAAHAVHPLAGQGANLGLADAARLAHVIEQAIARGEHPGDLPVLRRYERARKGANRTMLYFLDGLHRLFASRSQAAARLRGGGIWLFNHSGPIRERAVQVALGIDAQ